MGSSVRQPWLSKSNASVCACAAAVTTRVRLSTAVALPVGGFYRYRRGGEQSVHPPMLVEDFGEVEPVYEELPGWQESTVGVTGYRQLPGNARRYLERMQDIVGVPVDIVSTGPDRDHTIVLNHPFE